MRLLLDLAETRMKRLVTGKVGEDGIGEHPDPRISGKESHLLHTDPIGLS